MCSPATVRLCYFSSCGPLTDLGKGCALISLPYTHLFLQLILGWGSSLGRFQEKENFSLPGSIQFTLSASLSQFSVPQKS